MIVVCEPTLKSFSHEKLNEGFLYVVNEIYSDDEILFLAHNSHWKILKKSLKNNNVNLSRIQFENINISLNSTLSILNNLLLISKLKRVGAKKVIFLTTPKALLFCLKYLISIDIKMFFVLGEGLEELRDHDDSKNIYYNIPRNFGSVLKTIKFKTIYNKIKTFINVLDPLTQILKKFSTKALLEKNHNSNFNYLVISEHIFNNLKNKIDRTFLNINYINYPQLSGDIKKEGNNDYPKFAIFGYGNSKIFYNLNLILRELNIKSPFEIRIIGMDNRGTNSFPWVTCPSNGRTLLREEMDNLIEDIDFNLIIYPKGTYSLSCSASIIEAIHYCKPIIHLENSCISHYNKGDSIGYECSDLQSMAFKIREIVLNYNQELNNIKHFKVNLIKYKKYLNPDNNLERFTKILD